MAKHELLRPIFVPKGKHASSRDARKPFEDFCEVSGVKVAFRFDRQTELGWLCLYEFPPKTDLAKLNAMAMSMNMPMVNLSDMPLPPARQNKKRTTAATTASTPAG